MQTAWVCEEHEKFLTEDHFPVVAQIRRNPRYTNKRIMDPQLKCFIDEMDIQIPPEWGLPKPNPSAAYISLAKYAKPVLPMSVEDVDDMNLAWRWTSRHFGVYMAESRVISYLEAKTHFDMASSSGAPFNQHYPTKRELFESDPDIDAWLEADWNKMASDPNWTCCFTNSLKEELRTQEKIDANSIRTFLAGGVDAVAHGTRLFVDMNEKMYASHLKSASAVGMSPYKGTWDKLYQKLKIFAKGYALDESQYDSSLRAYMMWGCALFRWSMLAEQDRTVDNLQRLRTYYRNLVNTVVICPDGVLVMKKCGNPSGSVNTITDNTLILYTLMAYAWIKTSPPDMRKYSSFEIETSKALVGDDNTWTVSDVAHEFYNAVSVIAVWKTLGVTTTTDSIEPRKAKELDFLSAHTVFHNGMAVPVYNRTKLMTSLLYAPEKHITPATTLERVAGMLCIGWVDVQFRTFCREVIEWLLVKYDDILVDEPRWIMAKCQIKTDDEYSRLFTGSGNLRPQSYLSGARVKLIQPDKITMSGSKPKGTGRNPERKQQQKRGRGGSQQVTAPRRKTPAQRARRRRQRQRRRERRAGFIGPQRMPRVTGRGAYTPVGTLGSKVGAWAGEKLGGLAGDALGTVFGFGAYNTVKSNSLIGWVDTSGGVPTVVNGAKGEATIITHREYLFDLLAGPASSIGPSTPLTTIVLEMNPGNEAMFPWLSAIATRFQEWEMQGCIVEFKSLCSEFNTTFNIGSVILSADYNVHARQPLTKVEMENLEYSISCKPTCAAMPYFVECARALTPQTHLYTALNKAYNGGDPLLYDLGKLYLSSVGLPNANAGSPLGEIWVTYQVALYKPILNQLELDADGAHFTLSGCTAAEPLNGAIRQYQDSPTLSISIDPNGRTITLPGSVAEWLVWIHWVWGSGGVNANPPSVDFSIGVTQENHTFANSGGIDAADGVTVQQGNGTSEMTQVFVAVVDGAHESVTITLAGNATLGGDPVYGDLYIMRLPNGLVS